MTKFIELTINESQSRKVNISIQSINSFFSNSDNGTGTNVMTNGNTFIVVESIYQIKSLIKQAQNPWYNLLN